MLTLGDYVGAVIWVKARDKWDAISEIVTRTHGAMTSYTQSELLDVVWRRELAGSTGLEKGAAMPHGELGDEPPRMALCIAHDGTPHWSADGSPVRLIVLLVTGVGRKELALRARLARLLKDGNAVAAILSAVREEDVRRILERF